MVYDYIVASGNLEFIFIVKEINILPEKYLAILCENDER